MNLEIHKLYFMLVLLSQITENVSLLSLNTSNENPLLSKILQFVDSAASNGNLFEVTLKLLESVCVCIEEDLKKKQNENIDTNALYEYESRGSRINLYKKIYNKTCINLKEELKDKIKRKQYIKENIFINRRLDDDDKLKQKQDVNEKVKKYYALLFQFLISAQNDHTYNIQKHNLYRNRFVLNSKDERSVIIIVTLYPNIRASEWKESKTIDQHLLNQTLHSQAPIDIDIIRKSIAQKDDEIFKIDHVEKCHLYSLYLFIIHSKQKNKVKVFKLLSVKGTIKLYIDVLIDGEDVDFYTKCCHNDSLITFCEGQVLRGLYDDQLITLRNEEQEMESYNNIISNIKILVEQFSKKANILNDPNDKSDCNLECINTTIHSKTTTNSDNYTTSLQKMFKKLMSQDLNPYNLKPLNYSAMNITENKLYTTDNLLGEITNANILERNYTKEEYAKNYTIPLKKSTVTTNLGYNVEFKATKKFAISLSTTLHNLGDVQNSTSLKFPHRPTETVKGLNYKFNQYKATLPIHASIFKYNKENISNLERQNNTVFVNNRNNYKDIGSTHKINLMNSSIFTTNSYYTTINNLKIFSSKHLTTNTLSIFIKEKDVTSSPNKKPSTTKFTMQHNNETSSPFRNNNNSTVNVLFKTSKFTKPEVDGYNLTTQNNLHKRISELLETNSSIDLKNENVKKISTKPLISFIYNDSSIMEYENTKSRLNYTLKYDDENTKWFNIKNNIETNTTTREQEKPFTSAFRNLISVTNKNVYPEDYNGINIKHNILANTDGSTLFDLTNNITSVNVKFKPLKYTQTDSYRTETQKALNQIISTSLNTSSFVLKNKNNQLISKKPGLSFDIPNSKITEQRQHTTPIVITTIPIDITTRDIDRNVKWLNITNNNIDSTTESNKQEHFTTVLRNLNLVTIKNNIVDVTKNTASSALNDAYLNKLKSVENTSDKNISNTDAEVAWSPTSMQLIEPTEKYDSSLTDFSILPTSTSQNKGSFNFSTIRDFSTLNLSNQMSLDKSLSQVLNKTIVIKNKTYSSSETMGTKNPLKRTLRDDIVTSNYATQKTKVTKKMIHRANRSQKNNNFVLTTQSVTKRKNIPIIKNNNIFYGSQLPNNKNEEITNTDLVPKKRSTMKADQFLTENTSNTLNSKVPETTSIALLSTPQNSPDIIVPENILKKPKKVTNNTINEQYTINLSNNNNTIENEISSTMKKIELFDQDFTAIKPMVQNKTSIIKQSPLITEDNKLYFSVKPFTTNIFVTTNLSAYYSHLDQQKTIKLTTRINEIKSANYLKQNRRTNDKNTTTNNFITSIILSNVSQNKNIFTKYYVTAARISTFKTTSLKNDITLLSSVTSDDYKLVTYSPHVFFGTPKHYTLKEKSQSPFNNLPKQNSNNNLFNNTNQNVSQKLCSTTTQKYFKEYQNTSLQNKLDIIYEKERKTIVMTQNKTTTNYPVITGGLVTTKSSFVELETTVNKPIDSRDQNVDKIHGNKTIANFNNSTDTQEQIKKNLIESKDKIFNSWQFLNQTITTTNSPSINQESLITKSSLVVLKTTINKSIELGAQNVDKTDVNHNIANINNRTDTKERLKSKLFEINEKRFNISSTNHTTTQKSSQQFIYHNPAQNLSTFSTQIDKPLEMESPLEKDVFEIKDQNITDFITFQNTNETIYGTTVSTTFSLKTSSEYEKQSSKIETSTNSQFEKNLETTIVLLPVDKSYLPKSNNSVTNQNKSKILQKKYDIVLTSLPKFQDNIYEEKNTNFSKFQSIINMPENKNRKESYNYKSQRPVTLFKIASSIKNVNNEIKVTTAVFSHNSRNANNDVTKTSTQVCSTSNYFLQSTRDQNNVLTSTNKVSKVTRGTKYNTDSYLQNLYVKATPISAYFFSSNITANIYQNETTKMFYPISKTQDKTFRAVTFETSPSRLFKGKINTNTEKIKDSITIINFTRNVTKPQSTFDSTLSINDNISNRKLEKYTTQMSSSLHNISVTEILRNISSKKYHTNNTNSINSAENTKRSNKIQSYLINVTHSYRQIDNKILRTSPFLIKNTSVKSRTMENIPLVNIGNSISTNNLEPNKKRVDNKENLKNTSFEVNAKKVPTIKKEHLKNKEKLIRPTLTYTDRNIQILYKKLEKDGTSDNFNIQLKTTLSVINNMMNDKNDSRNKKYFTSKFNEKYLDAISVIDLFSGQNNHLDYKITTKPLNLEYNSKTTKHELYDNVTKKLNYNTTTNLHATDRNVAYKSRITNESNSYRDIKPHEVVIDKNTTIETFTLSECTKASSDFKRHNGLNFKASFNGTNECLKELRTINTNLSNIDKTFNYITTLILPSSYTRKSNTFSVLKADISDDTDLKNLTHIYKNKSTIYSVLAEPISTTSTLDFSKHAMRTSIRFHEIMSNRSYPLQQESTTKMDTNFKNSLHTKLHVANYFPRKKHVFKITTVKTFKPKVTEINNMTISNYTKLNLTDSGNFLFITHISNENTNVSNPFNTLESLQTKALAKKVSEHCQSDYPVKVTKNIKIIKYNTYKPVPLEVNEKIKPQKTTLAHYTIVPRQLKPYNFLSTKSVLHTLHFKAQQTPILTYATKKSKLLKITATRNPITKTHQAEYKNNRKVNNLKENLLDPFGKTNLYPVKRPPSHTQRKVMKRIHLSNKDKDILTMNTNDFFSGRRNIQTLEKFPQPHRNNLIQKRITAIPKQYIIRPKFDKFDVEVKPREEYIRPKPLFVAFDKDFYREDFQTHHRSNALSLREKVNHIRNFLPVPNQPNEPNQAVIERPMYLPSNKPQFLRDRIDSIRNYLHNNDFVKPTVFPIKNYLVETTTSDRHPYIDPLYYFRRSGWYEVKTSTVEPTTIRKPTRRQRRTIFFLSPTVPYYRYF